MATIARAERSEARNFLQVSNIGPGFQGRTYSAGFPGHWQRGGSEVEQQVHKVASIWDACTCRWGIRLLSHYVGLKPVFSCGLLASQTNS